MFDRARGWDFTSPGPGFGAGLNGAGLNGTGANGTGANGTGLNGAGLNGTGANGTGLNGAGLNGTGANGTGLNGTAWSGGAAGPRVAGGPPVVSLGLTHRIYPDGHAVAVIRGELDAATADQAYEYVCQVIDRSRGPVRIDLAGLTFCDARGLRTLVGVAAHARKAARRLAWSRPGPPSSRSCVSRGWMRTSRSCARPAHASASPDRHPAHASGRRWRGGPAPARALRVHGLGRRPHLTGAHDHDGAARGVQAVPGDRTERGQGP